MTTEQKTVTAAVVPAQAKHISKFVAKEKSSYSGLTRVLYRAEDNALYAADGKTLIRVPCCETQEDRRQLTEESQQAEFTEALIDSEELEKAIKEACKKGNAKFGTDFVQLTITSDKQVRLSYTNGKKTQHVEITTEDGRFPDVAGVQPKDAASLEFIVNAEYLEKLAQYAKTHSASGCKSVRLTVRDRDVAIEWAVDTDNPEPTTGLVMPVYEEPEYGPGQNPPPKWKEALYSEATDEQLALWRECLTEMEAATENAAAPIPGVAHVREKIESMIRWREARDNE